MTLSPLARYWLDRGLIVLAALAVLVLSTAAVLSLREIGIIVLWCAPLIVLLIWYRRTDWHKRVVVADRNRRAEIARVRNQQQQQPLSAGDIGIGLVGCGGATVVFGVVALVVVAVLLWAWRTVFG